MVIDMFYDIYNKPVNCTLKMHGIYVMPLGFEEDPSVAQNI